MQVYEVPKKEHAPAKGRISDPKALTTLNCKLHDTDIRVVDWNPTMALIASSCRWLPCGFQKLMNKFTWCDFSGSHNIFFSVVVHLFVCSSFPVKGHIYVRQRKEFLIVSFFFRFKTLQNSMEDRDSLDITQRSNISKVKSLQALFELKASQAGSQEKHQ